MVQIKSITQSAQPREFFAQFGKIRKGAPKQNGQWGPDLDHFRFATKPEYQAQLGEALTKAYGDKPKALHNMFIVGTTANDSFPSAYEDYQANQVLKSICDGETILRHLNDKAQYVETPLPCVRAAGGKCSCGRIARLNLIPRDACIEAKMWGSYCLETKSINDIRKIYAKLRGVEMMAALQGKTLAHIPFFFQRVKTDIFVPMQKDGKWVRSKTPKYLIEIDVEPQYMGDILLPSMSQQLLNAGQDVAMLESGLKFMTADQFADHLIDLSLSRERAWEIITLAGLKDLKIEQEDRYEQWFAAIKKHIEALPVDDETTEAEIID